MINVLVADENTEETSRCCEYLSSFDSMIKAFSANTGYDTLDIYSKTKTDILILNSHFSDIKSTQIVDRLSNTIHERKNNNIILTINSKNEQLDFVNTAKIYKFIPKPLNYEEIGNIVQEIEVQNKYDCIDEDTLNKLLFSMRIIIGSFQTELLKEAIYECYHSPYLLDNFDEVLVLLSQKHNGLPKESIRTSIRNSLYELNKYKDKLQNHKLVKMFEPNINITPKVFLEVIVSYLHVQKNQEIIF